jgi:hypothetical protein
MAKELDCEYFVLEQKPLISDTRRDGELLEITFKDDPSNLVATDCVTSTSGTQYFFSGKIADIIKTFKIYGLKIEPTIWFGKQKKRTETFFEFDYDSMAEPEPSAVHDIMDMEKSVYKETKKVKTFRKEKYEFSVYDTEKFVIDEKKVKDIPLEKRLIFRLDQAPIRFVFHKSVVEAIMAANPTGIKFIPLEGAKLIKCYA